MSVYEVWALWVCGCGYEERIWMPIDQRVSYVEHACLRERT